MRAIRENYSGWKELGPGGLPFNPLGWLIATALRPLGRNPMTVAGVSVRVPSWELPHRGGPRPPVAPYPIPHRQTGDTAGPEGVAALSGLLESYASASEGRMYMARSRFERRGEALFVADDFRTTPVLRKSGGELVHVHSGDGSLHVVTDLSDAQAIIDAGWGELHPLAGRPLVGLPEPYVLLYSPRDKGDLRQISLIVDRVVRSALQRPS
ncbi:luciferase domain-containing protein [Rhodococcus sp. EPR-157]|uniref:luciferase domain-containing protein n=1 Tax=Rhodococcus sp. EPR-157 TaxID=1813677 RepID=UPI0012E83367|nr:hypothetical protein [Rhodococcus sp. EPR-157]